MLEIKATMNAAAVRTDGEDTSVLTLTFKSLEDAEDAIERLRAVQRYHGQRVKLTIEPVQAELGLATR